MLVWCSLQVTCVDHEDQSACTACELFVQLYITRVELQNTHVLPYLYLACLNDSCEVHFNYRKYSIIGIKLRKLGDMEKFILIFVPMFSLKSKTTFKTH